MKPMYLADVEAFDSPSARGDAIRRMKAAGIGIPQIFHLFAFKPDRTDALATFTQGVMRGPSPLSPGERELIAAFTSKRNQCLFWIGSHAAVAAELLGSVDLVKAVLEDHMSAPITDAQKALFTLVTKICRDSTEIGPADIAEAKGAGWSDEALYDAITVCALFQFYNTWIDATGVDDMPASAYVQSGKRLVENGYEMKRAPAPSDDNGSK